VISNQFSVISVSMPESQADKLQHASSFQELEVYKKSRLLAQEVFELSRQLPGDERFALTDQIRRSSRSVGAQIAESWAKRRYPKHFISKLTDADGEQMETQHWLGIISDHGYVPTEALRPAKNLCLEIGRMLGSMIQKSESFAGQMTRSTPNPEPRTPNTEH
jgi:four helix bundle protein